MPFSPAYRTHVLDAVLGDNHAPNMPATVYVCLFTGDPGGNSFADEVAEPEYARVEMLNSDADWDVASSQSKANAVAVTFDEVTSGDWPDAVTHWGLADHATDSAATNMICSAALSSPVSPVVGDTPEFGIGTLVITS